MHCSETIVVPSTVGSLSKLDLSLIFVFNGHGMSSYWFPKYMKINQIPGRVFESVIHLSDFLFFFSSADVASDEYPGLSALQTEHSVVF